MATVTITPAKSTITNLRNILSRIDQQYGLMWTENRNAVHGNTITASIDFEENRDGRKPVTVTISSNYHSVDTLIQAAEKAKGKGYISHENGELVGYYVEIDHSMRPETVDCRDYEQADKICIDMNERGTHARAYKTIGDRTEDMYTGEEIEENEYDQY